MPSSSRFPRSGIQPLHGELIIVRRGKPLPNKGRHAFLGNEDRIWGESENTWVEAIVINNPACRFPFRYFQDWSFISAIEANNPSF